MVFETSTDSFWTPARLEIHSWFGRNAPSLGELYEASLQVLFNNSIPGKSRLVAHAVREIGNRLPVIIAGNTISTRVEYAKHCDNIVDEINKCGCSLETLGTSILSDTHGLSDNMAIIPFQVLQKISALLKDHEQGTDTNRDKALRLFNTIDSSDVELQDYMRPILNQWVNTIRWFITIVHDNGKRDQDINMNEFNDKFRLFENMLGSILRGYYKTVEDLDEILEKTNN